MPNEETIVADNTQRDAEVAAPKPNFELLSDDAYLNGNVNTVETKTEEVKTEPVNDQEVKLTEEVKTEEKKEEDVAETELALEGDDGKKEEVKEEVKSEEELVLTLDDDGTQTEDEDQSSWKYIAKLDGIELEEDSLDAYKEAITKPLVEQIEQVKQLTKESLLADLDPEHRLYMELAEAGLKQDEIINPLRQINEYKSMSSSQLYREDLTARFPDAPQEWIDAEVEKKVESGDVEHEATRIRLELNNIEKQIVEERQNKIEQYKQQRESFLAQKREAEVNSIAKALDDMPDFMRSPLTKEVKKGLADRYNNGKYDHIFNDPAMKAKFIAFYELGEKALKNIEAKSYNKGKLEIAGKLHNVPPLENVNGSREVKTVTGNFERLENDPLLGG